MSSMRNALAQIAAVTRLNVATIKERRGASIAAVVGVAGVVAVLVAVLSIAEGFRMTMRTHGGEDTAIVVRSGSDTEMTSILTRDDANIISQAPGVAKNASGPIASAELFVVVDVPKRSTGTQANVPLRGVSPQAFAVRSNIKIVRGRMFDTGKNEVIVGEGAEHEFAGLTVGSIEHWGRSEWKVVGVFSTGGTVSDSEIWCDEGVLRPVYRRGNTYQSVHVRLTSPAAFTAFKDALTSDPRLNVRVERESAYYADQSRALVNVITGLGTLIAALMAVGAIFGAL
ncbi:MAG TPA: ABC transporter permease, partial [Thermoanaerobaculia bacterium]|nr:ABC transporter permease [Thermoanaerobaculia bacterium]